MRSIAKFSEIISTNYANKVIRNIYENIYSIQKVPYIGRYVPELLDNSYRERICGNYRIIYFVSEKIALCI